MKALPFWLEKSPTLEDKFYGRPILRLFSFPNTRENWGSESHGCLESLSPPCLKHLLWAKQESVSWIVEMLMVGCSFRNENLDINKWIFLLEKKRHSPRESIILLMQGTCSVISSFQLEAMFFSTFIVNLRTSSCTSCKIIWGLIWHIRDSSINLQLWLALFY